MIDKFWIKNLLKIWSTHTHYQILSKQVKNVQVIVFTNNRWHPRDRCLNREDYNIRPIIPYELKNFSDHNQYQAKWTTENLSQYKSYISCGHINIIFVCVQLYKPLYHDQKKNGDWKLLLTAKVAMASCFVLFWVVVY